MPLSWNEIKSRALAFTNEWKDEVSEDAEAKSFWDNFFHVFGISRRRVATFEQKVKRLTFDSVVSDLPIHKQILRNFMTKPVRQKIEVKKELVL